MPDVIPKLQEAIRRAQALPAERQVAVAEAILIVISEPNPIPPNSVLAKMAREAIKEHRAGKTWTMDL